MGEKVDIKNPPHLIETVCIYNRVTKWEMVQSTFLAEAIVLAARGWQQSNGGVNN